MIINSTYTVYKRGTKTTRESRACLPVTGTFTFFKSFFVFLFFGQNAIWTAWTCTNTFPSNISLQISDLESDLSFQLTSETGLQVYVVKKRQHTTSLHTCSETEISAVFTETSSFKDKLFNTDCVGEIEVKVVQKVSDQRRSKQGGILQLKYGDSGAVKLLRRPIKLNITLFPYRVDRHRKTVRICRNTWTV